MRIKAERCGICLDWRLLAAHKHCPNCGAYHFIIGHKHVYMNRNGVEMVRGVPLSLQRVMERLEER
jgi:hypothetical protein